MVTLAPKLHQHVTEGKSFRLPLGKESDGSVAGDFLLIGPTVCLGL